MRTMCTTFALLSLLVVSHNLRASEQIEVLLVKQPGVSLTLTYDVLSQINETLENSDLAYLQVISAKESLGSPVVLSTACSGTNPDTVVECVRTEQSAARDQEDADAVVAVVSSLNGCGTTRPGTVNRPSIGLENHEFAYAVIKADCLEFPQNGMRVASHELGHILSLEHSSDASGKTNIPVSYNHAAEDFDDLTVMGNETGTGSGDCPATACAINDFFSKNGRHFPDGGSAGDSSYADACRVISNSSWDIVAAYRPLPPPPTIAYCQVQLVTCNGSTAMFAITPYINESYQITNVHMDTKKGAQQWSVQYDGPFTCPTHGDFSSFWYRIFVDTAFGSTMCTNQVYVNPVDPCQQDPW